MTETFFVREVGRGRGVQERSLEVTEDDRAARFLTTEQDAECGRKIRH